MESFSLKGRREKEEGGERWRDKQRGVSSFCSQYVFAVSWWSRSRRRQKAQFLLGRTMKTGLPSPPLPASHSSHSILSLCLRVRQVRRRLKEVLFRARFINGSKPPPSCSSTHKFFFKTMLHFSDGAVSQTPHRIVFFKSGSRSGWNIFQLFFFKNMFEFVVVWTISAKRQKTNTQNVSPKQKSHSLFFSFEMLLMSSSVIRRGTIREKRFLSAFRSWILLFCCTAQRFGVVFSSGWRFWSSGSRGVTARVAKTVHECWCSFQSLILMFGFRSNYSFNTSLISLSHSMHLMQLRWLPNNESIQETFRTEVWWLD